MDENWQKINIPLDSVIDNNMTDMLRNLQDPAFIFNRQVLQGAYLPTSLRFEKNGWFCGIYGYDYDVESPDSLQDKEGLMPDMQVERQHTYVSVAYHITSDEDDGDAVNFIYYPLTRVLSYKSDTEPSVEWVQDDEGYLNLVHVHGKTHDFHNDYDFYIDMSAALSGNGLPAVGNADDWITVDPANIDFDGDGNPDIENVIDFDQRRFVYSFTVYDKDMSFTDKLTLYYGMSFYIGSEEHEMHLSENIISYGDSNILTMTFHEDYPFTTCVDVASNGINICSTDVCIDTCSGQACAVNLNGEIPLNIEDNLTTITETYYIDTDMCQCLCINNETIGKNATATIMQNGESCQVPLVAAGYACLSTACPYLSCNILETGKNVYGECIYGAVPVWSAQTIYLLRFFGDDIFWGGQCAGQSGIVATIVPQQEFCAKNNNVICCCALQEQNTKTKFYCTVYGNCIYNYDCDVSQAHTLSSGGAWYIGSVNQCTDSAGYRQCVNFCIPLVYSCTDQRVNVNVCVLLDAMSYNMQVKAVGCTLSMKADAIGFSTGQFDKNQPFAPLPGSIPQFIVHDAYPVSAIHNDKWSKCMLECIMSHIEAINPSKCTLDAQKDALCSIQKTFCEAAAVTCNGLYCHWANNGFYANVQITPVTVLYPVAGWFGSYVSFCGLQSSTCVNRDCLDNPGGDMFCIDTMFCCANSTLTCRLELVTDMTQPQDFTLGGKLVICSGNGQPGEQGCSSYWCRIENSECICYCLGRPGKGGNSGTGYCVSFNYQCLNPQGCVCHVCCICCVPGGAGGGGGAGGLLAALPVCGCNDFVSRSESFLQQTTDIVDYNVCCGSSIGNPGGAGGLGSVCEINIPRSGCPYHSDDPSSNCKTSLNLVISSCVCCGCAGSWPPSSCIDKPDYLEGTSCWKTTCPYGSPAICPNFPCNCGGNGAYATFCPNCDATEHKASAADACCVNHITSDGLVDVMCLDTATTCISACLGISNLTYCQGQPGYGSTIGTGVDVPSSCEGVYLYRYVCCTNYTYDMVNLQNENNCFGIRICCNDIKLSNFLLCCCPDNNTEVRAIEMIPQLSDGYIYIVNSADAVPAWATSMAIESDSFWTRDTGTNFVPMYCATYTGTDEEIDIYQGCCFPNGVCFNILSSRGCDGALNQGGDSGYSICVHVCYCVDGGSWTGCDIYVPGGAGGGGAGVAGRGTIYTDGVYNYTLGAGSNGQNGKGSCGRCVFFDFTGCAVCDIKMCMIKTCAGLNCVNGASSPWAVTGENKATDGTNGTDGRCVAIPCRTQWGYTHIKKYPTCGGAGGTGGSSSNIGTPSCCADCYVKFFEMTPVTGAEPWSVSNETSQATRLGNTCGISPQIYLPVTLCSVQRLVDVTASTIHDSCFNLDVLEGTCIQDTAIEFVDKCGCTKTIATDWTRDNSICSGQYINPCVKLLHGTSFGCCEMDYLVCYDVACSSLIPQLYDTCDCPLVSVDKDNYVDGIMQYGNYSADPDLCPVPGYLTNMAETTLTSCIINCTTTTEPFMKVIWTGDYHVCTLLPLPYVRDFVDCDCVLRCGVVKQYDKDTYTVCYNCSDDLVINTNQKNASSLLYEPNITCYRETDTCAIGCMDVCICGADFDSATFTLSGIYHNKGTETLCLKCIDYDYLTLKYDGCTCNTCIKVQDILNNKTYLNITATNVNKSVNNADGTDASNETEIASIELNSEYQLIKQHWDSTVETENIWWLDTDHMMVLTNDSLIIREKMYDPETGAAILDDWAGNKWKDTYKHTRSTYLDSTVIKHGVSSVYGDTAVSEGGAIFWTINIKDDAHFVLNAYLPLQNMQKVFSQVFEIEEINYGQALSTVPNKLSMYVFMNSRALISQAEISMTHVGHHILVGIHVDSGLRQWTFVFGRQGWLLKRKITGYGYVSPNGSLTGGQFPYPYVNATNGFEGTVQFINDLIDYHNNSVEGAFSMTGIYGTQDQQWYLQKDVKKICSHIQFNEASDVKNHGQTVPLVCKWLPLQSTYSAKYSSPSFIVNTLTGFMPEPTTIGSIFDFGNKSINTLVGTLSAIASPSVWFLNICWTKFGFLEQAIGQYAYTYKTTDKSLETDRAMIEAYEKAAEQKNNTYSEATQLLDAFKQNVSVLTKDQLSFDKQEFEQVCTTKSTSNEGITNFWLSLLQTGISSVNNVSIANTPSANKVLAKTTPNDVARSFSQFAVQNALAAAQADLGINRTTDVVLASKVTAVKTLDMFYSTSSNSMMYAGPGYVCHNFIGYCVAQSMSNRFLQAQQNSMFTALSFLSNLSFAFRTVLLSSANKLFNKLADSVKESWTAALGSGTTWGNVAAMAMRAAAHVTEQLIDMNEFFLNMMPEILKSICPGFPNAQFSNTGGISSHDIDIEAKHNYGSKHCLFMWPCFGCESTYFTKETVDAVIQDTPVKVDFTPQNNSKIANTKGKINLYTSKIDNVTDNSNDMFKKSLYADVHSHYIYAKGKSVLDTVPPDTAVIEGATSFLPTVPFKNENIDVTMVYPVPPTQDYMIDDQWSIGLTANSGGILWISVKDTKLIDGDYSNMIITDTNAMIASPYIAAEIKRQIETDYIRPVAVTPNALAWNMTGLNVSYDAEMRHGFDGIGYRIVHWSGASGLGTEDLTLEYCFQENDHLKRSNILMPNHYYGNFSSLPEVDVTLTDGDKLYNQYEIDTKGIGIENITSNENKNLARYAMPVFTEQLSTMPSVVKTLSSYRLNVIQGITSLTTDIRLTQNKYKLPKSVDFNINKNLYRATDEYINALNESGLSVGDLTSKMGLDFIGATPTQAFFYSPATRAYYSFTGAAMIQKQDVWNRFKDIKDGKWDFVNQNVVFQCIGNMTRVINDADDNDNNLVDNIFIATMNGEKNGITGEITPPNTAIFDNESWFKTYSFSGGFTFQGPNRYIVNRFICLDYMIPDIIANKGKWKKVSRSDVTPFRQYNETFESVNDRVGSNNDYTYTKATVFNPELAYYYTENDIWKRAYNMDQDTFDTGDYYTRKLTPVVEGWTHNPFVLMTAPLGIDEGTDCLYEWELTFTWTDEMDKLYGKNEYACVNIMAQTMCPGGKKRSEPTHLYLHKDLFTHSANSGYYSFKYSSRNGAGNREQLFIWSDAYIAMTGLSLRYSIVTDRRTTPLATSQVDIQQMKEF